MRNVNSMILEAAVSATPAYVEAAQQVAHSKPNKCRSILEHQPGDSSSWSKDVKCPHGTEPSAFFCFVRDGSRISPDYDKGMSRSAGTILYFFGSRRTNAESMHQNDQAFTDDAVSHDSTYGAIIAMSLDYRSCSGASFCGKTLLAGGPVGVKACRSAFAYAGFGHDISTQTKTSTNMLELDSMSKNSFESSKRSQQSISLCKRLEHPTRHALCKLTGNVLSISGIRHGGGLHECIEHFFSCPLWDIEDMSKSVSSSEMVHSQLSRRVRRQCTAMGLLLAIAVSSLAGIMMLVPCADAAFTPNSRSELQGDGGSTLGVLDVLDRAGGV